LLEISPTSGRSLLACATDATVAPVSDAWTLGGSRRRARISSDGADPRRGTAIQRDVSECRIQVEGRSATSPVALGGPGDAPLLGAVTLETLGLM